jgi:hypothetical protein
MQMTVSFKLPGIGRQYVTGTGRELAPLVYASLNMTEARDQAMANAAKRAER